MSKQTVREIFNRFVYGKSINVDKGISDLSELVRGLKKDDIKDVSIIGHAIISNMAYNRAIDDVLKLLEGK